MLARGASHDGSGMYSEEYLHGNYGAKVREPD